MQLFLQNQHVGYLIRMEECPLVSFLTKAKYFSPHFSSTGIIEIQNKKKLFLQQIFS